MLLSELNRMSSPPAVPGHQRHGHRRGVDDALRLARARGGPALLPEGHRPADEPQLHPPRRRGRRPARRAGATTCCELLDLIPPRLDEYDILMTDQPIWRERLQGVGVHHRAGGAGPRRHRPDPALHRRGLGPAARHAVPALRPGRLRRDRRLATATASTATPSGSNEVRESMRIVRQILDRMPAGDYRIQDKKVTPPPRARIDESMEALIHHFKIFTEGFKVPEGEVYVGDREPPRRDRLLHRLRRLGQALPHAHPRRRASSTCRRCPHMMRGGLVADAVAVISSVDPDPRRGRPLSERGPSDRRQRARSPRRSSAASRGPSRR